MVYRRKGRSGLLPLLFVLLLLLPLLPTPASAGAPREVGGRVGVFRPRQANAVPVGLSLSGIGTTQEPDFWGTTISAEARLLGDEAAILNATGVHVLVWPGANAGDEVNMLNNTLLKQNGTTLTWKAPETNEMSFIRLCRDISCEAILQVPGEIDDPSFGAAEVNYTEQTLGFRPAYWEIGNEPELWQHWGVPWNEWNQPPQTGAAVITPAEYAWEVHNYTPILRSADPNIQILGLAGTGRPNGPYPLSTWVNLTVQVDGPELAGIAFHVYTAGNTGILTLPQFYAFNTGTYSVNGRIANARSAITNTLNQTCPSCSPPPIFLTELGSALSHYEYDNLSRGFAGGLSMAASEIQGLELNLATVDVFATIFNTSNSWFDTNGTARPNYTDYAQFLSHLGTEDYPASFEVPSGPDYTGSNTSLSANLYAIGSVDPALDDRSDLLLVNQNLTTNVSLTPSLPGIAGGNPVELWTWSGQAHYSSANGTPWVTPLTSSPVATWYPNGTPNNWTLPPQTIALFEAYPTPASPVTFNPSGLPSGTRWYLSADTVAYESAASALTVLLPSGNASLAGVPMVLPYGTFTPAPAKRADSFPPPLLSVAYAPLNLTLPFLDQWNLTWTVLPAGRGTLPASEGWVNASKETNLTAAPSPGWLLTGWEGSGLGNYSGPGPVAKVHPGGPLHEDVYFQLGYNVTFVASGLSPGTPWAVTLGSHRWTSTNASLSVLVVNGSYVWKTAAVAGYTEGPPYGNVTINGNSVTVTLTFTQNLTGLSLWWSQNDDRVIAAAFILVILAMFVLVVNLHERRRLAKASQARPPPQSWPPPSGPQVGVPPPYRPPPR